MFSNPGTGASDNWPLAELNGHTLIIKPTAHEPSILTQFGEKDAIRVNVVSLNTGECRHDVLWFGGGVIGALKREIGNLVLAQVTQGQPKPGQAPPWVLAPMADDPATVDAATKWVTANPGAIDGPAPAFAQPTAPATPAAPAVPPIGGNTPAPTAPAAPAVPPVGTAAPAATGVI